MKILPKFVFGILLLLSVSSCQDVIQLNTPEMSQSVVISGRVTDSLGTTAHVSLTTGYFEEGGVPVVNDAQVYLYEDGSMVSALKATGQDGEYHSTFNGSIGNSYEIEVVLPESYELSSTWRSQPEQMQSIFPIDSFQTKFLDRTTNPKAFEPGMYALLYFAEPEGRGDNYRFQRWLNDSLFTQEIFIWNDSRVDGAIFGGEDHLPGFGIYGPMELGDSLVLEVASISTSYFHYLALMEEQVFRVGGPFDPPPSPIIGNIYNADKPDDYGFGYFAASALRYANVEFAP